MCRCGKVMVEYGMQIVCVIIVYLYVLSKHLAIIDHGAQLAIEHRMLGIEEEDIH